MSDGGRGNGYGIDFSDEFGAIGNRVAGVLFGKFFCAICIGVDNSDESALVELAVDLGVYGPHFTRPNDGGSYLVHIKSFGDLNLCTTRGVSRIGVHCFLESNRPWHVRFRRVRLRRRVALPCPGEVLRLCKFS